MPGPGPVPVSVRVFENRALEIARRLSWLRSANLPLGSDLNSSWRGQSTMAIRSMSSLSRFGNVHEHGNGPGPGPGGMRRLAIP